MPARLNLVGSRFGRLLVLSFSHVRGGGAQWVCRCDCGARTVVSGNQMRQGKTTSCGCWRSEVTAARSTKHGQSYGPEYYTYRNMLARCYNEKHRDYADYGGRGIGVCARWLGEGGFGRFYSDMGARPDGMSIDRKNSNRNYSPSNCRWATVKQQNDNRRMSIIVSYKGQSMVLKDVARKSGIAYHVLRQRYHAGERGARLLRPTGRSDRTL